MGEVLSQPRYRLHILTSRARHLLGRRHSLRTPPGYFGALLTNAVHHRAMGALLERVNFSTTAGPRSDAGAALFFAIHGYRTRQVRLDEMNFNAPLQASCSIPFVLRSVHDIPGAPPGAYWDGGITDYHLHLNYNAVAPASEPDAPGLVLYPHFQKAIVPGWLDKGLKWRHHATHFLDNVIVLAPDPAWVKTLPYGKLPDRTDFTRYGKDLAGRVKAWSLAVDASRSLVDEFQGWIERHDMSRVAAL